MIISPQEHLMLYILETYGGRVSNGDSQYMPLWKNKKNIKILGLMEKSELDFFFFFFFFFFF